ncbi:hypothetical protein, partial [Acinetobacter baumannii]|uniref:hypothetical protein n=1 Tax=Acinetobacter baumannii TaxID=470 RepID=UPI001C47E03E
MPSLGWKKKKNQKKREIAKQTASFRHNANQNYPSLVSTIKDNQERSAKLTASTEIISDNAEA